MLGGPRSVPYAALALALGVSSCTGRVAPRPRQPASDGRRTIPEPLCAPSDSVQAWGVLGRTLVAARIAASDAGYRGDLRMLGSDDVFAIWGARGSRWPSMPGDDPDWEAPVYECRLEVRSAEEVFGVLTGRCTEQAPGMEPSLTVEGSWSIASSTSAVPALLDSPTYRGVPDYVYAALAREEGANRDCAAFVDVREARRLAGRRTVLVYEPRYPCRPHEISDASRYRVAIVDDAGHITLSGPLQGTAGDSGDPTLSVYEIGGRSRYVFHLTFTDDSGSGHGKTHTETRGALFGLTATGRAGQLVALPSVTIEGGGCNGPLDTTTPWLVELDGTPPAELVLQHDHIEVPCSDGPDPPPEEGDTTTLLAYRFDEDLARFDPIPVDSWALDIRSRHGWASDVSEPAEDWWRLFEDHCEERTDGL